MTREQALALGWHSVVHENGCYVKQYPRSVKKVMARRWRVNGNIKTWKREPDKFRIPVKHGLAVYDYITEDNIEYFHLESECPLNGTDNT